ncbi:hypothetical protein [Methylocucumis oryzae]|uniref:Uncharacterized protein n=1 Tax=Methylocucumis oryzae TaxID=1632867 RepID=A0A0F3II86_9GAMM|nr:hypothetical protein [Methylocucumis oryzae]KJV05169.1 hypothetical protein VZ94_20145 [Methylocucumis oryzae]
MNTELMTLNDRINALKARANAPIEVWQPEPNESLIGEYIGSQKAVGIYGENYQILIKDENGQTTAAWLTPWLKDNLKAQGATEGDLVAITFLGKKQGPAGRSYNAYSLMVDKE